MKIPRPLTVVYLDHTAKWSGGEIALLRMLEALDRGKVNPIVVLAEDGPFRTRLEDAGVETHVLPLSEKVREIRKDTLGIAALAGHAATALALLTYALKVARFAKSRHASLLHCNSLKSDFYGALAGRLARIPVVWHVRDHIDPTYLPAPAVRLFRGLARRLPSCVITNSASTTDKLFPGGVGNQCVHTVHDGLADRELQTLRPVAMDHFTNDPPRVGMIGRIVPWKGQHIFLEAAQKVIASGIRARFVIVGAPLFGEQAYEAALHRQAHALGDVVEFMGFQSDIPAMLHKMDILVHASTSPEPFGQVVIEGMAEGVPVIASAGGGVCEIVSDGVNGILTPMGDVDALAAALGALLVDPCRASAVGRAGWELVRARFTATRSARGVEAAYEECLGRQVG